jgi:hypothetical protein
MTSGSVDKEKFFLGLVMFCFILLNCATVKADETLIYVRANLSERYIHYNEVISKYGTIWIGYNIANNKITTDSGDERFILEKAYYYYKKDDSYILLGSIDKTGLYDKNGNCLKPVSRVASGYQVAGISSLLLATRTFSPTLILQSQTNSERWRETETFVNIDIDTQQDTIILMDMSRFLAP